MSVPAAPAGSALRQLVHLGRGVWFRRLFSVRLTSQLGDGVFQVALASYALFSDDQPSPAAIASALAVVLLPFSLLGPFAGVLLDRWSRRQVLARANFVRVALVLVVAAVVASDLPDPVFYAVVLLALSVNRFLLAALSAALPHTVLPEELVTANALTPTAGTMAFVAGLALGGLIRGAGSEAWDTDLTVLATAATLYAAAGALALRIPRDLLGPDFDPARPAVRAAVGHVLRGLLDGLRHLRERRSASAALAVIGSQRYWFGIFSVSLILLHRNHFNAPTDTDAAFAGLATATLVGGAGFLAAAVVTPSVTARLAPRRWVLFLLAVAAVAQVFPASLYTEPALLVSIFGLGLAAQGIKICVDTLVQLGVDDAYRGRVFSIYDVLFNVAFVAAAGTAALVLPADGVSPAMLGVSAVGYLATAAAYARVSR